MTFSLLCNCVFLNPMTSTICRFCCAPFQLASAPPNYLLLLSFTSGESPQVSAYRSICIHAFPFLLAAPCEFAFHDLMLQHLQLIICMGLHTISPFSNIYFLVMDFAFPVRLLITISKFNVDFVYGSSFFLFAN